MSDMRDEMLRTLDRIVRDTVTIALREAADERANEGRALATGGIATAPLWTALEAAGITAIGAGDDQDVAFADAMQLIRRAAYHALPVPLGETIMARRILGAARIEAPDGAITIASPAAGASTTFAAGRLTGTLKDVPFGRSAAHAVVASDGAIHLVAIGGSTGVLGINMAGEPRDEIDLARARVVASARHDDAVAAVDQNGALLRAVQMSGALSAALDHALTWANDRVQFGKPIAKQQAVQHLLAQLASETAAAGAAADFAIEATCSGSGSGRFGIAVAKARTGEAAGKGANIAHAVLGALGFTREHALHYATRRLWAWRNEFGSEARWQAEIGRMAAMSGGKGLWSMLDSGA